MTESPRREEDGALGPPDAPGPPDAAGPTGEGPNGEGATGTGGPGSAHDRAGGTADHAEGGDPGDPWSAFGRYLRGQRQLARLSLRQLAELTRVSNPYLSQIERGLHQPSVAVIKSLAQALGLSVEDLLAQAAGVTNDENDAGGTEAAIRNDSRLDQSQKSALLAVYRSMAGTADAADT